MEKEPNFVIRALKRVRSVVSSNEQQSQEYPHVIFELQTDSTFDSDLGMAAFKALADLDYPLALELENTSNGVRTIIRSKSTDRFELKTEGALFLGLTEATRKKALETDEINLENIAGKLAADFLSNNELYEAFKSYYSGLGWSTNQDRFIAELFIQSDTGLQGLILARRYKNYEKEVTPDGKLVPKPLIPLTNFPIIAALVVSEVSNDNPKQKYDFGRHDLVDLVLNCDSTDAHQALVKSISSRLLNKPGMFFDGPGEFEHKHRNIVDLIGRYKESFDDEKKHQLLKQDLICIFDNFTGSGGIATSLREENQKWRERFDHDNMDVSRFNDIVKDLLRVAISAPDPELSSRGEDLVLKFIPENSLIKRGGIDPLSLDSSDLMLVLIDALDLISEHSDFNLFERLAERVFGSTEIGLMFAEFVRAKIAAVQIRNKPLTILAWEETRRYGFTLLSDQATPEQKQARLDYESQLKPARQLEKQIVEKLNQLILSLLGDNLSYGSFRELLNRIRIDTYQQEELPLEYPQLILLAAQVTGDNKNSVLWFLTEKFKNVYGEYQHTLTPVVMDMMKIALGDVDSVPLPDDKTSHGLSAVASLIREKGHGIFKNATQEQLTTLGRYANAILDHAANISTMALISDGQEISTDIEGLSEWQVGMLTNLKHVLRDLRVIAEYYHRYLKIEAVKVEPSIYFPWMLEQFAEFWFAMQREVDPRNEPREDILRLFKALSAHVKHWKGIKSIDGNLPEDFDCIESGHLDTFLNECYIGMVISHDIKYNSTVWQKGLPFLSYVISLMPPTLLAEMVKKRKGSSFARYLQETYDYLNKK